MIAFAWNLLLALIWMILTGSFSGRGLIVGLFFGYLAIAVVQPQIPVLGNYAQRVPRFIAFVGFFLWQVITSNLRVAWEVLTPGLQISPAVVGVPLDARTDIEITVVANLISLTPGTLSMDISDDRRVLYVHAMYLEDEQAFMDEIKYLESRVLRVMR
jgi:multicomponent Na+:H+ antiporter subunit E